LKKALELPICPGTGQGKKRLYVNELRIGDLKKKNKLNNMIEYYKIYIEQKYVIKYFQITRIFDNIIPMHSCHSYKIRRSRSVTDLRVTKGRNVRT